MTEIGIIDLTSDESPRLLKPYPYEDGVAAPKELLDDVIYYSQLYFKADTPEKQAGYLVELSNKISDLKSYMPSYDPEYFTLDWERDDEEYAR